MTIQDIKKLMDETKFPAMPRADWFGSNHFEIQDLDGKALFWWWSADDITAEAPDFKEEVWKRLGLVMELALIGAEQIRQLK